MISRILITRRLPTPQPLFPSSVESLMSSAWFSIREMAVFLVLRRTARDQIAARALLAFKGRSTGTNQPRGYR